MKKSLVAIAALTLVGAASAQVTITGNLSGSYQKSLDGTRGLSVSDNSIFFGITEDLGGGMKFNASTGFDAGGRNKDFTSSAGMENFSIAVTGGFGGVKFASYESDGPFAAVAISGASLPVGAFDANGANMGKRAREAVTYSTPVFGGFKGALTYVTAAGQFSSTPGLATNAAITKADGTASAGFWDSNTKVVPALSYTNGPLSAYVEYASFNPSYSGTSADTITQPTATVSYDFGVAKVAAGWTKPSNNDVTIGFGVNVPVGALTLGLETFSFNSSAAQGTATYTDFAVAYSLSKRTSLKASFGTVNDAFVAYSKPNPYGQTVLGTGTAPFGAATADISNQQTRIGLFHSF
jgi:predicted porin